MNSKLLIAGLALISTLGGSLAVHADPFEPRQGQGVELGHYYHQDRRYDDDYRRDGHFRHDRYKRLARVLEVKPIWPRHNRYCRIDGGHREPDRDRARVVGALAGGVVGNLIGREHDNALVGTVAGALIGGAGADIIVRHGGDRHRRKECVPGHKLKYHQRPVAYWVRYIYRGQIYTTRTRNHPGRYIEIDKHYGRRG